MPTPASIARRFAVETKHHTMTVLHDDGLYRHLRFVSEPPGQPRDGAYWFDIITAPNTLLFRGDGTSYAFSRLQDMFEFFRGPVGRINPGYWAEKVTSDQDGLRRFDQDTFRSVVLDEFIDAAQNDGVPIGTGRALREQVLDDEWVENYYEIAARHALEEFEHKGFRFEDTYEWDFSDWDWWFLWACHAIVWAIAQYDAHRDVSRWQRFQRVLTRSNGKPVRCTPLTPPEPAPHELRPKRRPGYRIVTEDSEREHALVTAGGPRLPQYVNGRRVVDVDLPELEAADD